LLWEVRVSHFDNANEKPNNPELADQLRKFHRKYGRTLAQLVKLQKDGLNAEQIQEAASAYALASPICGRSNSMRWNPWRRSSAPPRFWRPLWGMMPTKRRSVCQMWHSTRGTSPTAITEAQLAESMISDQRHNHEMNRTHEC
jgi:hypothetical protein